MSRLQSLVTVFTRLPEPGRSKTRLIPALGDHAAAELQRRMTEHVVRQARILAALEPTAIVVSLADGSVRAGRSWLGVPCTRQGEGDLGARLERAFKTGARRAHVTTVVGGDCPTVTATDLLTARTHAAQRGAAIIPACDGGFCALALRVDVASDASGLLRGVEWGTGSVSEQTIARVSERCPHISVLPPRRDVDVPEDLPVWESVSRAWYGPVHTLGVVVPVLDDSAELAGLLPLLNAQGVSVVVADGGGSDGFVEVARRAGASTVEGVSGRGAQMNAAAAACDADALLFLHADTRLPTGFARLVLDTLDDPSVAVGAFGFATVSDSLAMRLIEMGTRLRRSVLGMPYGDQGLYCRRAVFEALGGFPDFPVMEDYEFVRRARRIGRVVVLPQRAFTSDRRWHEQGHDPGQH